MRCCTLLRHVRAYEKHTDYHGSKRIHIINKETIHIGLQWKHNWYPTIQWVIGCKCTSYSRSSNGSQKQGGTTQKGCSEAHQRNQQEVKSSRWHSTGGTHWYSYYKGSEHLLVVRKTYEHCSRRSQLKREYQCGTSGINLESDHSETEVICPDATHQKIQGIQNVWVQTTQLHDGNQHPWCTGQVHPWPLILPGIWKQRFLCGGIPYRE